MLAGIDMIHLHTREFKVMDRRQLTTNTAEGPNIQPQALYVDGAGVLVVGKNSYHNGKSARVDIDNHGMRVCFNPSKILHPYNILADTSKLPDVLRVAEKELAAVGVKVNLLGCGLSRLDLTKQDTMPQPVMVYADAFKLLKGKRLATVQYPNGFVFRNGNVEVVFYDKGEELQDSSLYNFMRGEVKYKKGKVVRSETQLGSLSDLMQAGPEHLTSCYNSFLNRRVFSQQYVGEQLAIDFTGEVQLLKMLRGMTKKGAISRYFSLEGIEVKLRKLGGFEGLKKLLFEAGFVKSRVSTVLREVERELQMKAFLDSSREENTVTKMIAQVQTVFAA
jgi:hypothetical protein